MRGDLNLDNLDNGLLPPADSQHSKFRTRDHRTKRSPHTHCQTAPTPTERWLRRRLPLAERNQITAPRRVLVVRLRGSQG